MNQATSIAVLAFLQVPCIADGTDFETLCDDRAAIERVYHAHRLGTKQSFEQAMPRDVIELLVRLDQHKEAVLRKNYGVEVTPAMVTSEAQRILATTRAPEVLAEIRHVLGDDAGRFARSMARPIVVERELRRRFDNDDKLHAAQRREVESAREALIAKKPVGGMREITWQFGPRADDEKSEFRSQKSGISPPPQTENVARSGAYSVEATAQLSQAIASPHRAESGLEKLYYEDLDPHLQKVLRVQLQKPGDVSAVIETPQAFLVFLAKHKTAAELSVSSLIIAKCSYDEWLAQQPQDQS